MKISIIIPVLNESAMIVRLLAHLRSAATPLIPEIIVVDGGSTDGTREAAEEEGAIVFTAPRRGRASQMNYGAAKATGQILYFVHADSLPPVSFVKDIFSYLASGYHLGCYRLRFDSSHMMLRFNEWYTRFNGFLSGGGDQSLFVLRSTFELLEGFNEERRIMEDFEFVRRARRGFSFCVMKGDILVSARKYRTNNYTRVSVANIMAISMDCLGIPTKHIARMYSRLLRSSSLVDENKFPQVEKYTNTHSQVNG